MFMRSNEAKKLEAGPRGRSTRWLDFAAAGSVALGVATLLRGGSSTVLANAISLMDNSTYALHSAAARSERDVQRNHRIRRLAGAVICAASLYVAADAVNDLVHNEVATVDASDAAFALAATALNGSFVVGLKRDAAKGTAHRDAWRHAVADTASSAVATGAIAVGASGYPMVDALAGITISGWTIAMTFPTRARIEGEDEPLILPEATGNEFAFDPAG